MTKQQLKITDDKSVSLESVDLIAKANAQIPKWRNWGDHPVIVAITFIGTLLTLIATAWGLPKIIRESNQETASREIIMKTPIELVRWYNLIDDEVEATRQAKILYIGKQISVSGKPDIVMVNKSWTLFKLPNTVASIRNTQLPATGLSSSNISSLTCRIKELNKFSVSLNECELK